MCYSFLTVIPKKFEVTKRNLISEIKVAKGFRSMNKIKGHRKCIVVLKFLKNNEGEVAPLPCP